MNKYILASRTIAMFIFLIFLFIFLEGEWPIKNINEILRPLIFSISALLIIFKRPLKKTVLLISMLMLLFMIATYLMNQLLIADWIGSLGFGILIIVTLAYMPTLIKKGYIEKF